MGEPEFEPTLDRLQSLSHKGNLSHYHLVLGAMKDVEMVAQSKYMKHLLNLSVFF